MKKIFIVLSVAAVLAFSLAPAMANVPGARDIAPGSQFKSFFLVNKDRVDKGAGPTTLLQISETKGQYKLNDAVGIIWCKLHFNFYTMDSVLVYNRVIPITKWQTLLLDMGAMIKDMGNDARAALLTTFEGKNYYAGYVEVTEETFGNMDNIVADVIQCDLSAGIASAAEIPMKAYVGDFGGDVGCWDINHVLYGFSPLIDWWTTINKVNYEVFSGEAMWAAMNRVRSGSCDGDAGWFALYPRYLINDATSAKTYWLFLRSSVYNTDTNTLIQSVPFHTWVINGAEDFRSVTIGIREFTILDAGQVIPSGLMLTLPYIGQMNMRIPGDPMPSAGYLNMELVGWNWKMAKDPANPALNWGVMTMMAADAGTGAGYKP